MNLHPVLAELFRSWDKSGISWALLRVPEDLAAPEGDVDILVQFSARDQAFGMARGLGFVPVPGYAPDTHLLQYHRDTKQWLWLHCTTQLAFGPYRAVRPGTEHQYLEARQRTGPIVRLAASDEFWVTMMHALLSQGRLSAASKRRLRNTCVAAQAEGALPEAFLVVLPAGWTPVRMIAAVRAEDWPSLLGVIPALRERALHRGRPPLALRLVRGLARALSGGVSSRRRVGISVALLGPDGAGKSTLAAGLQNSFVFPVQQIYMGLTGGWLRRVDRLRIPGLVRVGRLCVIWSRYLRGRYHTLRGRLVVFDRYTFDAAVPPPHHQTPLRRVARWIDGHSCPAPDLVMILDAPGETMHRRKGEYSAELLEEWRQHFLSLRHKLPHAVVLDTAKPPDEVRADATDQIWARYATRWGRG